MVTISVGDVMKVRLGDHCNVFSGSIELRSTEFRSMAILVVFSEALFKVLIN
jgi:hypothetical protein